MLEKIGLPAKPSLRGSSWVVDASHCQGCSSQFTFINRKHHCRRCGGLFCSSCTQQRMVLRGQGDSPVRICEHCKKLEEAARFEKRNGLKNKAGRGGSKIASNHEDILSQILGSEGTDSISSARASPMDMLSGASWRTSNASSSSTRDVSTQDEVLKSLALEQHNLTDAGNTTPEELRQQAIEEKTKYKTLKAEGKPEEALKAFKRGKELDRQAGALEIFIRKNRKKALVSIKDDSGTSASGNKISTSKSEGKSDLADELKELGWLDMDLRDADKRPASLSLESELSTLLAEVSRKTNTEKRTHSPDKSQVIAHKKKALELKRAGNLAEAKEELKKAKVLEKEIEEQELLGESEESDEELSSLIRNIDDYKDEDLSTGYHLHSTFDFDFQPGIADNLGVDDNLEVEDEDMDDPEIAAALKSLGWSEETDRYGDIDSKSTSIDKEALMNEIHSLKREALNKRRAGNNAGAMALLKKAKGLEMDLDCSDSLGTKDLTAQGSATIQKDSCELVQKVSDLGAANIRDVDEIRVMGPKSATKSKLMIQKELLALKKSVLALRRKGKVDEAEEELKKGKVLEKQLEDMDKAAKVMQVGISNKPAYISTTTDPGDDDDVTDQDMYDPTYLSLLKNLGWHDDVEERIPSTSMEMESSTDMGASSTTQASANISTSASRKSKAETQRELLGLKRKSLALRRQGEMDEAEEVLKMAKLLEVQLAEIEYHHPQKEISAELGSNIRDNVRIDSSLKEANLPFLTDSEKRPTEDMRKKDKITSKNLDETGNVIANSFTMASNSTQTSDSQNDRSTLQEEILARKKEAVLLKREGKLAEAKEELRQAKLLEKHLEEKAQPCTSSPDVLGSKDSSARKKEDISNLAKKPLTARDRFKLQQESLGHKRQALKLRREGKTEEADAELELAKALEAQLEESASHDSRSSEAEQNGDVSVEDFLDPQLMSALKALGIPDISSVSQGLQHPATGKPVDKVESSSEEKKQLEEQIKTEKLKALNLKRSGKQAEAMDALRRAKHFEKKLNSLSS